MTKQELEIPMIGYKYGAYIDGELIYKTGRQWEEYCKSMKLNTAYSRQNISARRRTHERGKKTYTNRMIIGLDALEYNPFDNLPKKGEGKKSKFKIKQKKLFDMLSAFNRRSLV